MRCLQSSNQSTRYLRAGRIPRDDCHTAGTYPCIPEVHSFTHLSFDVLGNPSALIRTRSCSHRVPTESCVITYFAASRGRTPLRRRPRLVRHSTVLRCTLKRTEGPSRHRPSDLEPADSSSPPDQWEVHHVKSECSLALLGRCRISPASSSPFGSQR